MSHIFFRGLHVLTILSSVNSASRLLSTAFHFLHHMWQVFRKTSKVFIKYMIKSEYKFLYVYDYSFLVHLSCSYPVFSIKSRPLNINIQRKFFFKNRMMSNVTAISYTIAVKNLFLSRFVLQTATWHFRALLRLKLHLFNFGKNLCNSCSGLILTSWKSLVVWACLGSCAVSKFASSNDPNGWMILIACFCKDSSSDR